MKNVSFQQFCAQKTHQDGFTQARKVLFNCREELAPLLSTEPTVQEQKDILSLVV